MAIYKTVYEDPTGQKKTGYIIQGTTYQDEQGTTPVSVGSTVTTANGSRWYKGENGSFDVTGNDALLSQLRGNGNAGSVSAAYQQALENNAAAAQDSLKKAQDAQDALIKAKTDAAVQRLQAQVDPLNAGYDAQKKQNYRGYVQTQEGLREQLAQAGLGTSGAQESARVRMSSDYAENQNAAEAARQQALADISAQIEQARLSGDYEGASQMASYYQQLAALQQQAGEQAASGLLTGYQLQTDAAGTAYQRQQAAAELERQARKEEDEAALQKAQTLAEYGDFSGYRALGYDDAQIARMKNAYDADRAATQSGGTRATATDYDGLGSYAQTLLGLWNGNKNFDLSKNLESAAQAGLISQQDYIAALQVASAYGYGPQQTQTEQGTAASGLTAARFNAVAAAVQRAVGKGDKEEARALVNEAMEDATDKQYKALLDIIAVGR